ncbi:MAG TPA: hypothetical protein VD789_02650 [Thermomicrobiales bacterium]|nr:hypothetical protein [Thermomicrobiales bacterium]
MKRLPRETAPRVHHPIDLGVADMASVRRVAASVAAHTVQLATLIHCADIMAALQKTEDGFELVLATNHRAPVLPTHELLTCEGRPRALRSEVPR